MRNKILTISFLAFICVFAFGSVIAKDRDFSDMENRNLTKFPEITGESIVNGEFTKNFEKYMSDQIIFKDFLVKLKVTENLALNQKYINGVYFAEDMLIQDYQNPYNQLGTNVSYVNEFAEANSDLNCTWLLIPNACYVYEDRLPSYASCYDQSEVLAYIYGSVSDEIAVTDCFDELMANKDEYIYYKTDHHWTMQGAYIGYESYCEFVGIEDSSEFANNTDFDLSDVYDIEVASDEFYGTLYSNAPTFSAEPDEVLFYHNPDGEYNVEYLDEGWTSDSLYNYENLEIKDKYTTYLDGNHSIIKITSNAVSEDNGKLLVVKDSYAHSFLPLLADNYSEIIVVDLRYYHDSVSKLAKENGIENVLFINNIEFLSTDNNFLWLY